MEIPAGYVAQCPGPGGGYRCADHPEREHEDRGMRIVTNILEYFVRSEAFDAMQTWSIRGLPRPSDDKYAARLKFSGPVHAVWAYRR